MSDLINEWHKKKSISHEKHDDDDDEDDEEKQVDIVREQKQPIDENEEPIFKIVKLDWRPTKEHGSLVSLSVGNNVLLIGTENCFVIRWNIDTNTLEDIPISKKAEDKIHRVFLDPAGQHSIVGLENGQNFYIHSKSTKPSILSKTKGVVIESIAWDPSGESPNRARMLIGSNKGQIYECIVQDDKEKHFKKVYDLNEGDQKEGVIISGLRIEIFPLGEPIKYFVMAATPIRHYQFIGGPTFEAMFAKYASNPAFLELPGSLEYSELRFYSEFQSKDPNCASKTCAWLTGAGIYYGNLVFGSQDQPGDRVVEDGKLLSYPNFPPPSPNQESLPPLSLILTQFHFLLLNKKKLFAINQLNEDIVYEEPFPAEYGIMKGLANDPRHDTVWLFSDKYVFEVEVKDEDRDVWRLYLQEGKFAQALEYCNTPTQKEQVLNAQADHYFQQKSYELAAKAYAQTQRSFEEVTLKFVNVGSGANSSEARSALKTYLLNKLDTLAHEDLTQQTMICTWLTEIFLDSINSLGPNNSPPPPPKNSVASSLPISSASSNLSIDFKSDELRKREQEQVIQEFHAFLNDRSDCLNKNTTFELISSHGRVEDLLEYATVSNDLEWVISHYVQQRNYSKALTLLQKHEEPQKIEHLYYKFAPVIMASKPKETVDMLIEKQVLEPSKLIPALMRYETIRMQSKSVVQSKLEIKERDERERKEKGSFEIDEKQKNSSIDEKKEGKEAKRDKYDLFDLKDEGKSNISTNHAIRYLEHCVKNKNKDPAIHNYLVSLYAKEPMEEPLLRFIANHRIRPYYDYKYALRLCHDEGKKRACVGIYVAMGLYEEAVKLALEVDIDLAKKVVDTSEQHIDSTDRKRLWLLIARKLIDNIDTSNNENISRAMGILKECDLKIEDILPYFPDFVKIGAFKEEICKSLETYNYDIEELKKEMDEFTKSASLLRNDINELRNRSGFVTANQKCDLCSQPVLTRPFFLFPCTHVFHVDCMTSELRTYLDKNPRIQSAILGIDTKEEKTIPSATASASPSTSTLSTAPSTTTSVPTTTGPSSLLPSSSLLPQKDTKTPSSSLNSTTGTTVNASGPSGGSGGSFTNSDIQKLLEQYAQSECIFCGDVMIESVQEPFISLPEEAAEVATWQI